MVINLEEPYSSLYRKGYLRIPKDGRKMVDLFNSSEDRTTISYARYAMCVNLGYILSKDYEVDHIDRDKTNDDIINLQVLTVAEHRQKNSKEMTTGRNLLKLICPQCNVEFAREARLVNVENPKCSRKCNGANSKNAKSRSLSNVEADFIRDNYKARDKNFGIKPLCEMFGISKGTLLNIVNNRFY